MQSNSKVSGGIIWAQVVLVGATIAAFAAAPPSRGRMLIVPLWSAGEGEAVRIALDHGARLLDRGPMPRSIIVDGDRAALSGPLIAAGMALTNVPNGGCGTPERIA